MPKILRMVTLLYSTAGIVELSLAQTKHWLTLELLDLSKKDGSSFALMLHMYLGLETACVKM